MFLRNHNKKAPNHNKQNTGSRQSIFQNSLVHSNNKKTKRTKRKTFKLGQVRYVSGHIMHEVHRYMNRVLRFSALESTSIGVLRLSGA